MKTRQVWYRDFDGWFYGQIGQGRRRKQQRILKAPNTPADRKRAQKKYEALLEDGADVSRDTTVKRVFLAFLKKHSKRHCSPETHA
jgi:hypothetical protein